MTQQLEQQARGLDERDPLKALRAQFLFPPGPKGQDSVYLCGNSLGLQPKKVSQYIQEELQDWAQLGVEGHIQARHPWLPYHEFVTESLARVVGAKPQEVIAMNSLSTNLHLMMVSFYQPRPTRYKILIEGNAFPSDQYAVASQARFHGYDPSTAIQEILPRAQETAIRTSDLLDYLKTHGSEIALVLLGSVNYLSGQAFDIAAITEEAHRQGCKVGFDLAHGVGNLKLSLHDWGPDFAVWCSYKYLNAGPGAIAGAFIHERHLKSAQLPRFEGWWGTNKSTRFKMGPVFDAIPTAEAWQLSNPPILQLAALRASLELFDSATMAALRVKSESLTGFLETCLAQIPAGKIQMMTPADPAQRGCQLSLRIKGAGKELLTQLAQGGVICDFREPDVIRVAPAPLYNGFSDVFQFTEILSRHV